MAPPLPPFTLETAIIKVRKAEDAWNTCDPERVSLGYTEGSVWRNRSEFLTGRAAIVSFLTRKWSQELDYRLIKALWAFTGNRIAVRFAYEWHDQSGNWFRSYGNENWEFDDNGLMAVRHASINDLPISQDDRKYHWDRSQPRPADHPSLSDLGFWFDYPGPLDWDAGSCPLYRPHPVGTVALPFVSCGAGQMKQIILTGGAGF
jgi:nuclear transport factor 2 (NTF2) superfamily protein